MYILGIGGVYHDATACLIKDGKIIAATEEERFTRKKHQTGFPKHALQYCLREAGIRIENVDHIGFFMDPWLFLRKNTIYHLKHFVQDPLYHLYYTFKDVDPLVSPVKRLKTLEKKIKGKVHYIVHHLTHAASAFLVSPFEEAAILSIDQRGEWSTTAFGKGKANTFDIFQEIHYPHSLGMLYALTTEFLGFKPNNDEYKVMGLASFGEPEYINTFRDMIKLTSNGRFELNLSYFNFHARLGTFSEKFYKIFGDPRVPESAIDQKHKNIASSLQKVTEEVALHMANFLYEKTRLPNLCLAGGVALNCVMNTRILEETPFSNIYIQPAASDAGCSLGSAFYVYHSILGYPRSEIMSHAYYGESYSDEEIKNEIESCKLPYEYHKNICKITAKLLTEGKMVGWFQGRMEWGPRALGNRSILADPTSPTMQDTINKWVKFREDFRPFAPSVLAEKMQEYFETDTSSPFMLHVFRVKEEKRKVIPSVTHIDGTARVQTVEKETNPRYFELISEFEKLTGVPIVLNTSFNVRGEPIVRTPKDAIRCFFSNGLDYLVMGNYLLKKPSVR